MYQVDLPFPFASPAIPFVNPPINRGRKPESIYLFIIMAAGQSQKPDEAILDQIRSRLIETGDWERYVPPPQSSIHPIHPPHSPTYLSPGLHR